MELRYFDFFLFGHVTYNLYFVKLWILSILCFIAYATELYSKKKTILKNKTAKFVK